MKISFTDEGWEDYQYWSDTDKKIFTRLNRLIKETARKPFEGIGKPDPLRHEFAGYWLRRIDEEHRLIYRASDDELMIVHCRHHYKR